MLPLVDMTGGALAVGYNVLQPFKAPRCAIGRSILVTIWHLLANPEARFTDLGPDWHARKGDRDRKTHAHLRELQALGLNIEISEAAA